MSTSSSQVTNNIVYTDTDFTTLQTDMLALIPKLNPNWTNATDTDMGVTLLNVFCGICDMLSYYLNNQAYECYLPLAGLRQSVINITSLIGYRLARPSSATLNVTLTFDPLESAFVFNKYDIFTTADGTISYVVTSETIALAGSTSVTLTLTQGVPVTENFVSDGSYNQSYTLTNNSVSEDMLSVIVGSSNTEYTELQKDTYLSNIKLNYFFVNTDADNTTKIEFSSVYGSIPSNGDSVKVTYLDTLGVGGSVTSGMITKALDSTKVPTGTEISQNSVATSGTSRESVAVTKKQAPREIRTLWRAVTAEDYKTLLDGYPGVLTSNVFDHSVDSAIPIQQVVCVVAPIGGGALTDSFFSELKGYLNRVCMITTDPVIKNPQYVDLTIKANIYVGSSYDSNSVILAVTNAIKKSFYTGVYDFGSPVRFSQIVSVIQGIAGVSYVTMVAPLTDVPITNYEIANFLTPEIALAGVV